MNGTLDDLRLLLQLRLRLFPRWLLARYASNPRGGKVRLALMALLFLGFLALLTPTLSALFGATVPDSLARYFLAPSLTQGLSVLALLIFFYAMVSLIATLTYGTDLRLLLLSPISPRVLLAEKMLSVILGFAPLLLFSLVPVFAIGQRLHLGPVYDLSAILAILLTPITPTAVAMLLVLVVLRWVPPARARAVSALVGTVAGGLVFVATQLTATTLTPHGGPPASLPAIVPTSWLGRALAAAGEGNEGTALAFFLASFLLAALLAALAIELSAHLFATGWGTYQEVGRRRGRPSPPPRDTAPDNRAGSSPGGGPLAALVQKEWLSLRRDPKRLAALAYPLLIAGFFSYRILAIHRSLTTDGPALFNGFLSGSFYFMLTFTTVLLVGSLAPPLVNGEGRSLYLLALAPVRTRDILATKWAMCAIPPLILVEALLLFGTVTLHIPPVQTVISALVLVALAAALSGLVLTINLLWPRLEAEGAGRASSVQAGVIGMVGEALVAGSVCILLILTFLWWDSRPFAAAIALCGIALVSASTVGVGVTLGTRLLHGLLDGSRQV